VAAYGAPAVPDRANTDAAQQRSHPGRRCPWRVTSAPTRSAWAGGHNTDQHPGHIRRGGAVNASGMKDAPQTATYQP
jgi:hypothetical protein